MESLKLGELFRKLRPQILDLISLSGGGPGPFAPSPHDLNGAHHSGTLADAQMPTALLRDGSRSLLGNLAVAEGKTIDGVDLSAHASNAAAHHEPVTIVDTASINLSLSGQQLSAVVIPGGIDHGAFAGLGDDDHGQYYNAARHTLALHTGLGLVANTRQIISGNGLTGGGDLTANRTLGVGAGVGISVAADSVAVDQGFSPVWTGNHIFQGGLTTRHIMPELTDTYDLGSSTKLWRKGWLSELDTVLFAENTMTLLGGWFTVGKGQGSLPANVGSADTTIDFGQTMIPGHFVVFRSSLQVEYVQVGSLVSGTTYNVTRNLDGSGINDWPSGSVFLILGTTGDGRIEINAQNTPKIQILKQGALYNSQTEMVRIGDLNGSYGVTSELYGIGLGDFASGNYLKYNSTEGFLIKTGDGDVLIDDTGINISAGIGEAFRFLFDSTHYSLIGLKPGYGLVINNKTNHTSPNDGDNHVLIQSNFGRIDLNANKDINLYGVNLSLNPSGNLSLNANGYGLITTSGNFWATIGGVGNISSTGDMYLKGGSLTQIYASYGGINTNLYVRATDGGYFVMDKVLKLESGANLVYEGNLKSKKNSIEYQGYIFVPLPTPVQVATGGLPIGTYNWYLPYSGIPYGVKAVSVWMGGRWGGANNGYYYNVLVYGTSYPVASIVASVANMNSFCSGIVPVVSDYISGNVGGANMAVSYLWIYGYWI